MEFFFFFSGRGEEQELKREIKRELSEEESLEITNVEEGGCGYFLPIFA